MAVQCFSLGDRGQLIILSETHEIQLETSLEADSREIQNAKHFRQPNESIRPLYVRSITLYAPTDNFNDVLCCETRTFVRMSRKSVSVLSPGISSRYE